MKCSKRTAMGLLISMSALAGAAGCERGKGEKVALPERPAGAAAPAEAASGAPAADAGANVVKAPGDAPPPAAAPVAAPAAAVPQELTLRLTGQVTSVRSSKIAFKIVGFVATVTAKAGHVAKKGEVLATLEEDDFKIKLDLAQARREQAKVQLEAARKELEREKQLKAENASTMTVFEQRQTAFDSARIGLRLAELDVVQAERTVRDTKLVAPYDCVVREQLKFEGENVAAGAAVFEVVDTSVPEITFEAPEAMLGRVKVGATLDVQVPSGGYAGKAEIVRIVPVIAEKTRTFRVIAKLSEGVKGVFPGSYAEAKVD